MSPKKATNEGFSTEEKAAMKERAQEMKAEMRASKSREEGEKAVFTAIEQMEENDRILAMHLHTIISASAPELMPKTWYGMPAYTNRNGKVICFFQAASKFNTRYATFGFQHDAALDEGNLWATSFALIKLTADEEETIKELVKKAVSQN
jgi:uncharacterized protein YdhG (YjbR/CyaY superfamily)